ncbi:hypothetical protein CYY_000895 [Polysphondylium violaceum]|uniref:Phosphoglycerate mutase family protein n=1 Tax=Polysphondylium violaceum TaxID=133409 RepID=A0A8J4VB29_9MYCE|nr:hypothetical protein CYY_000895 [Polysphondylium violaceum]
MNNSIVYLTRHGLREDWFNKAWKLTAPRPADSPLSASGFEIAKELGIECKRLNDIKHIISSPMERCVQTSTEIANQLDLPIKIDYGVIEWVGPSPNPDDSLTPLSNEELQKTYNRVDLNYESTTRDIPERETVEQLHSRCKVAVKALIDRFKGEPFIIVSHAATLIALGRGVVGDENYPFRTGVCSLTKINNVNGKWCVEYTGRTDYMKDGEQSHWTFKV